MTPAHATADVPSPWVTRWAPLVRAGGTVLDVACGGGRHARYFAARGCTVTAVDRDAAALSMLNSVHGVTTLAADIEGDPWPFAGHTFDAVVVTNYLHRPLFAHVLNALAPDGVLIYETFALGNERYGRPSNPAFLLQHGELLDVVLGRLDVVAYEDVTLEAPRPACVQRLCAQRALL
jgi:SAM-dependent methyltransferase